MQFKTIFIKTFQRSFQNIEKIGTHDLNYHGVWKPNYLLLYKEIYQKLCEKLDEFSKNSKETFIVLPKEHYENEWINLKKKILSNQDLLKTLNEFFGGRQWKIGAPSCWRLKPLHIRPTKDNTSDGARFWHLDNIRDDYLKLFINLMDIENNHGPFAAISAAESKKIIKENKSDNRYDLKDQEFGSKVIKATGSIGTSTFCTTSRCLHRGGFQAPGYHRDMLQIHFVLKKPIFGIF